MLATLRGGAAPHRRRQRTDPCLEPGAEDEALALRGFAAPVYAMAAADDRVVATDREFSLERDVQPRLQLASIGKAPDEEAEAPTPPCCTKDVRPRDSAPVPSAALLRSAPNCVRSCGDLDPISHGYGAHGLLGFRFRGHEVAESWSIDPGGARMRECARLRNAARPVLVGAGASPREAPGRAANPRARSPLACAEPSARAHRGFSRKIFHSSARPPLAGGAPARDARLTGRRRPASTRLV